MVGVAQLVERWIVAPVAVGSNPIAHPVTLNHRDTEAQRKSGIIMNLCRFFSVPLCLCVSVVYSDRLKRKVHRRNGRHRIRLLLVLPLLHRIDGGLNK